MQRATFFTFLLVFGLTFISCSEIQDKEKLESFRQEALILIDTHTSKTADPTELNEITDPSNDIAAPAFEDELLYEFIDTDHAIMSKDTVILTKEDIASMPEREYILGGAVYSTVHYAEYLKEVVPEKDKLYDNQGREIPTEFGATAFPNPTSGIGNLKLEIPVESEINISLLNMTGGMLHDFKSHIYLPGTHELNFDLTDQPAGMYLIMIQSEKYKDIVRLNKL